MNNELAFYNAGVMHVMDEDHSNSPTPITNLKTSTIQSTHIRYFTGGLAALPMTVGGYVLGPVQSSNNELIFLRPMSFEEAVALASMAKCYYVGTNEIHEAGPERSGFWYPTLGARGFEQSADSWTAIAYQASVKEDSDYRDMARYLSVSIRSAGWRLRDVSERHHEQLQWALLSDRKSGSRYSLVSIFDLYLAVHSLVAELCAARDYLAQIAALHVQAKAGTDSLARLCAWLDKAGNAAAKNDPMVQALLVANGSKESPGWLAKLGELRNQFMHRQPMAANPEAAALLFQRIATRKGLIPTIRLSRFSRGEAVIENEDPFVALLRFWIAFEALSRECVALARYPAVPPSFKTNIAGS